MLGGFSQKVLEFSNPYTCRMRLSILGLIWETLHTPWIDVNNAVWIYKHNRNVCIEKRSHLCVDVSVTPSVLDIQVVKFDECPVLQWKIHINGTTDVVLCISCRRIEVSCSRHIRCEPLGNGEDWLSSRILGVTECRWCAEALTSPGLLQFL